MGNAVNLISGQKYKVIKPFVDFDHIAHPIGETWTFVMTNFLPYDDGLTLHLIRDNINIAYRLQWRKEEQAEIIENFKDYVEAIITQRYTPSLNPLIKDKPLFY